MQDNQTGDNVYILTEDFKFLEKPRSPNGKFKRVLPLGIRRHLCSKCFSTFSRSASLKRHVESVHSHEHPLPCYFCGIPFFRRDHLHDHLRRHHNYVAGRGNISTKENVQTYARYLQPHLRFAHHGVKRTAKKQFYEKNINDSGNVAQLHENTRIPGLVETSEMNVSSPTQNSYTGNSCLYHDYSSSKSIALPYARKTLTRLQEKHDNYRNESISFCNGTLDLNISHNTLLPAIVKETSDFKPSEKYKLPLNTETAFNATENFSKLSPLDFQSVGNPMCKNNSTARKSIRRTQSKQMPNSKERGDSPIQHEKLVVGHKNVLKSAIKSETCVSLQNVFKKMPNLSKRQVHPVIIENCKDKKLKYEVLKQKIPTIVFL